MTNKRINPFNGLGVALVTPFKKNGAIDFECLESLVESVIEGGTDFICALGTTAETPCLDASEKRSVIDAVIRVGKGRVPILLGAGGNCTSAVADYLKEENLAGIDGVLVVTPFYNKPSQEGLYQHFRTVAGSSQLPVVLYNVPGRTGVNIEASTTLRVARDCENVVAIKEASGRIGQIEEIIAGAPDGFEVISGDDAITFELLGIGAAGVISVIGNAYPAEFGKMVNAALGSDFATALHIHRRISKAFRLLSQDGNPSGIKSLLAIQGKAQNVLRLPLVPARKETYDALADFDSAFRDF